MTDPLDPGGWLYEHNNQMQDAFRDAVDASRGKPGPLPLTHEQRREDALGCAFVFAVTAVALLVLVFLG